jgi:hypothetical protein
VLFVNTQLIGQQRSASLIQQQQQQGAAPNTKASNHLAPTYNPHAAKQHPASFNQQRTLSLNNSIMCNQQPESLHHQKMLAM